MAKVVINSDYGGGFALSDRAYERLHELGVPLQKYVSGDYAANAGEVIFDRDLTPPEESNLSRLYWECRGNGVLDRYWDLWISAARSHPLIVRVVEELGAAANGPFAQLKIVEVPDGVEFEIENYDGMEHIAEVHRTWH